MGRLGGGSGGIGYFGVGKGGSGSFGASGRAGGLGAPRYGVKPTVMGRPAGV